MIRLFDVRMEPAAVEAAADVLRSGWITQGPKVDAFERTLEIAIDRPVVTVNSGTTALELAYHLAGLDDKTEVVMSPMTCLSGAAVVRLADGSTTRLSKIVNKRLNPEVMSFNRLTGRIEAKRVRGWVKQSSKGASWFFVRCANAPGSRLGSRGIFVTGDHELLTERGYVRADQLRSGERVATCQRGPNALQREVIEGTLLGDGSFTLQGKGYSRFSVSHADDQREWCALKGRAFVGLHVNGRNAKATEDRQASVGFDVFAPVAWREQRKRWYRPTGRKIVPDDLRLTAATIATWYLDDGSYQEGAEGSQTAVFCTDGFSPDSFWKLFWKLAELGFRPHAHQRRPHQHRIALVGFDVQRLFDLIGAYVPPTMRYKLSASAPAFDAKLWELGEAVPLYDEVVVEQRDPPASHHPAFVYCLEVEDNHNFVAADMVVSNCIATALPLLHRGVHINWCDVGPEGCIHPMSLPRAMTDATRAIVAVDWGGLRCDFDALHKLAPNTLIIEDAAHRAPIPGVLHRKVDYTAFSFQAIKFLTTGDGGALACPKDQLDRARRLRWFGFDRTSKEDFRSAQRIADPGFKWHMNDVAAAIGSANFDGAKYAVRHAKNNAAYYFTRLRLDGRLWGLPSHNPYTASYSQHLHHFWLFTILVDDRDGFIAFAKRRGVEVSRVHTRIDQHPCMVERYGVPNLPGVDHFDKHQVSIPCGAHLSDEDGEIVANTVEDWAAGCSR